MDENDPSGCWDWQGAEWDQKLKVSQESRGKSKDQKWKHSVEHAHNISMPSAVTWEPRHPKACQQTSPPGRGGQAVHEAPFAAGCFLLPQSRLHCAGNKLSTQPEINPWYERNLTRIYTSCQKSISLIRKCCKAPGDNQGHEKWWQFGAKTTP